HHKADSYNIAIASPANLRGFLSWARFEIEREHQARTMEVILAEVSALLGSIATAHEHIRSVGRGIESAARHYQKLTGSMNGNLLPKARKIGKLGIPLPGNKKLPSNLQSYHLVTDSLPLIEGEAAESEDNDNRSEKVESGV